MEISQIILTMIEYTFKIISWILNVFVQPLKKRSPLVLNNIEIQKYVDPRGVPFVPIAKDPILLKAAKNLRVEFSHHQQSLVLPLHSWV